MDHDVLGKLHILEHAFQLAGKRCTTLCDAAGVSEGSGRAQCAHPTVRDRGPHVSAHALTMFQL